MASHAPYILGCLHEEGEGSGWASLPGLCGLYIHAEWVTGGVSGG